MLAGINGPHDNDPLYDLANFQIEADLIVWIDGVQFNLPANIGVSGGQPSTFIHTDTADGKLQIENANGQAATEFVTLGDFFDTWRTSGGDAGNNPDALFNDLQLFDNIADAEHAVQMFVNGEYTDAFEDYQIHDGDRIVLAYTADTIASVQTNIGPLLLEVFQNPVTNTDLFRAGETETSIDVGATTDSFLRLINDGLYDNSLVHRFDPGFVFQGGGFTTETGSSTDIDGIDSLPEQPTITNEPGLSNLFGTIAFARSGEVNSATNEWFINIGDNVSLDTNNEGFTVFGQVLDRKFIDDMNTIGENPTGITTNVFTTAFIDGVDNRGSASLNFNEAAGQFDLSILVDNLRASDLTGANLNVGGVEIFDLGDGGQWVEENGFLRRTVSTTDFPAANIADLTNGLVSITLESTSFGGGSATGALARRVLGGDLGNPPITDTDDFVLFQSFGGGGTIQGTVFNDIDDNGVLDPSDTRISGTQVFIDANDNGSLDAGESSTFTDINGNYFFHVEAGTYTVRQITPDNFTQSSPLSPNSRTVTLEIGDTIPGVNFGNRAEFENSLSGFVFIDHDNDGIKDDTDTSLVGVRIILRDAANNIVEEVDTAADGSYRFVNLVPGTYSIEETQPESLNDGPDFVGTQGGSNLTNDLLSDIVVVDGTEGTENNFTELGPAQAFTSLADFIMTRDEIPNFVNRFQDMTLGGFGPDGLAWLALGSTWNGSQSADLQVSDDGLSLTFTVVNADQQKFRGSLETINDFVTDRGTSDGFTIFEVTGTQEELPLEEEPNNAPTANNEAYSVTEGETLTVDQTTGVLANDQDDDNDNLTAVLLNPPDNGTVSLNSNGSFTYTPNAGFTGTDAFTYQASDGVAASNTATVNITVNSSSSGNTAPLANDDAYNADINQAFTTNAANGVLANDQDPNADPITARLVTEPSNGTIVLNDDGSFTYTPNTNFSGADTFTYQADDGTAVSNVATVNINVQLPDNSFAVAENSPVGTNLGRLQAPAGTTSPVVFDLSNPSTPADFQLQPDDHLSGNLTGSVVLIEYLDLQCPACAAIHPTIEQLKQDFGDDLLVVTRHFPLTSIHPNAEAAAVAAEAAGRQGAFDEMVNLLFERQADWSGLADPTSFFANLATELNLDVSQFQTDSADPALLDRVDRDADVAANNGFAGTPTFILDGQQIATPSGLADFSTLIQQSIDALTNVFTVNRETGDLFVRDSTALDFETNPLLEQSFIVVNGAASPIEATILLTDVEGA